MYIDYSIIFSFCQIIAFYGYIWYNWFGESMAKKKKKVKRTLKLWVWIVLALICLMVVLFSLVNIFFWKKDSDKANEILTDVTDTTDVQEIEDSDQTELINQPDDNDSDYWYYIKFPLINVDFAGLLKKNSDTAGWINVNNTNINYPYVWTTDNEYYLNHSYDKSYNEAGWVFLDYRNNKDLTSKNNILYAHSRLDKTMFGSLSKVLKEDWYTNKDNHIIRLSTEKENTLWQIFSVYKIVEESYYITTDFASDSEYQEFLDTIKGRSLYDFNTTLTTDDKVLTLSTCYSDTERTVVHAKLIKREAR